MKYERFIKKTMPFGTALEIDGENYLSNGSMAIRLPEWCGQMGKTSNDNELIDSVLNEWEWTNSPATLNRAYLENPDDKGKDIIRVFSSGDKEVHITNEEFGLIEKSDNCFIAYDGESTALLVGKGFDVDDFEPDAIIMSLMEG